MDVLIHWIAPIAAGFGFNLVAGKSRGRNARNAFKSAAWGCWLLLLANLAFLGPVPPIFGIGSLINLIIWLTPSAICFLLAAASMVKEMRAQKEGEFTDAA
jgi:hypothetical protein